jgi:hypothetical protein
MSVKSSPRATGYDREWETAAVSWSLFVMPLHTLSREGMVEWIASAEFARGVPDSAPAPRPLPSVADVLEALRAAGCHGTNWFRVLGDDTGSRLPECREPSNCAGIGGLDLGEVSIYAAGQDSSLPPVPADAPIETVTFRKPNASASLRAVCALASLSGPQLVFDDSASGAFVVQPGEQAHELADEWPW